jgi:hypothetical protein
LWVSLHPFSRVLMVDVNVRICLNSKAFLHKLVGHGLAYPAVVSELAPTYTASPRFTARTIGLCLRESLASTLLLTLLLFLHESKRR